MSGAGKSCTVLKVPLLGFVVFEIEGFGIFPAILIAQYIIFFVNYMICTFLNRWSRAL